MAAESGPGEQQYSLRWNDFHSAMLFSFRHLRDEEDFVDVRLACDGIGPGEQQYSLRWNDFHSAMLSSFRHLRDEEDVVVVTLACDGIGPGEQQYSLRWNDFHSAMLSSFRHLRDEEDFVDVTLACDGLSFSAHKVVLSACSPYFRKLLKANPCQHPIVILRDIHNKDMDSLLRFMYHGEVHIGQEQLPDFLKAAQLLQVRGLTDVPTQGAGAGAPPLSALDKISPASSWPESGSAGSAGERGRGEARESRGEAREDRRARRADGSSSTPPKRARSSDLYNAQMKSRTEKLLAAERSPERAGNNGHDLSLLNQALESVQSTHMSTISNSMQGEGDESSSDAEQSDNEMDLPRNSIPKQEPLDYGEDSNMINANGGILDPSRTPNFPGALLNLQGLLPGPSGMHGAQDNFGASRRAHELMRVRATDPRPCPKCGKIYRSAHTLRTHLEDKHTICPGYRCPLCGTVAKSRNSLHSHMSRQHRGISTKDLPVLPMPSKFDPELASKLLAKAGVNISPAELRARASPTGPRRSDIKLDAKSGQSAMSETSSMGGDDGADDLSITPSHRYSDTLQLSPPHINNLTNTTITKVPAVRAAAAKSLEGVHALGLKHDDYAPGLRGSALIDTYFQLINESTYGGVMSQEQKSALQAAKLNARLNLGLEHKPYPELSPPPAASLPPPSATLAHQHFFRQMQRQYTEHMSKPDIARDEPLDLGKERQRLDSASDVEMTDKSDERERREYGSDVRRDDGEQSGGDDADYSEDDANKTEDS